MAKEKVATNGPPQDSPESILKLTIAGNLAASGTPGVDVYKERNAILEQRRKARVFYDRKTGLTRPGYTAEHLRQDCERRSTDSHSDSLARTIKNATGVPKPFGAASHHIVSSGHREAEGSRTLLFGWGIGINDADNGVYLRDIKYPCPKGLEKATVHDHIHSFYYHLNVLARLLDVDDDDAVGGRKQLKTIKGEILTDQFPYRKQL